MVLGTSHLNFRYLKSLSKANVSQYTDALIPLWTDFFYSLIFLLMTIENNNTFVIRFLKLLSDNNSLCVTLYLSVFLYIFS